ncbi:solute carrier family 13 member 2-like isoform X2 [Pangasianodon hypophthalmus]|uniref:solute carrier family 13 member 2-like isoform X2 n=1 Tax=Pangasianodon hypophthalmus TaxID=310915 RepID=UPI0023070DA6|nr:solute carrier family 13 member 2-like isoform X2 [Pangasianodon hypophthalmus]
MANTIKWMWDYRNYVITIVTPLLILPLPLIVNTSEAKCGFVLILMALYWCTECLPLAITALLPVIFFPMMGIMTAEQVCIQYFSDSTMLGAGGLMVAIAVIQWNLHKRLALAMVLVVGVKPALLMLGFMSITAFLSMWISNIASTAIMLPIVHAMLEHLSKTEAEDEERELQQRRAIKTLQVQESRDGTDNIHNLPIEEELSPEELLSTEQRRLKHEQKHLRLTKGMSMSVCYAASIGGTATLTGSLPNLILKGQIDKIFPENRDVINYASWFGFSLPNTVLMLILSWLLLQFMYLGFNVKNTLGCGMTRSSQQKTYQMMRQEFRNLGSMSFAESCVLVLFILLILLWFTREPGFIPGWASLLFNQEKMFVTDGTVSIFVSFLFFIIPSKLPRCWHTGSLDITGRSEVKTPATLLNWDVVQKLLPWNILLLLGGAFALAKGSEISNLSFWLGQNLLPLGNIPPVALSFMLCLVVTMLTEICNNAVISTVFLPVLASLANTLKVHPLSIMLPSTISASFAFMLPVATPPNAITFNYANLKIMDMVKPGLVLNLLGVVCINFAVQTWGSAMFHLNEFPAWANFTIQTL